MFLVRTLGDEGATVSVMKRLWLCVVLRFVVTQQPPHRLFPARPRFLCTVHDGVLLFVSRDCARLRVKDILHTDYRHVNNGERLFAVRGLLERTTVRVSNG